MKRTLKYGEIFLVDFEPSIGHEYQKQRPAIIIQSNRTIPKTNLITVMAISSKIRNKQPDDILIKKDTENNLFTDSIAKAQAIHAFDKSRFIKKIGQADSKTLEEIAEYLKEHFNL